MTITIRRLYVALSMALASGLTLAPAAFAKVVTGSGMATSVTANFSYDGITPGNLFTGSGKDNFGGSYTIQGVEEFSPTTTACTTSDGSPGVKYDLVESDGAGNYASGQTYWTTVGAPSSSQCLTATGKFSGAINYVLTGGTGKFAEVAGSFTVTFTGQTLAAPGMPPGSLGLFGAGPFTTKGTLTK